MSGVDVVDLVEEGELPAEEGEMMEEGNVTSTSAFVNDGASSKLASIVTDEVLSSAGHADDDIITIPPPPYQFSLDVNLRLLYFADEFERPNAVPAAGNNFLKGVEWSPDGTCLLTNSEDRKLRVFEVPSAASSQVTRINSVFHIQSAETVYDYCWFPAMNSNEPASCVFASTCKDQPVHLWDAFNGQLRASYRSYDDADEIESAISLDFSSFTNRLFDVSQPGRDAIQTIQPRYKADNMALKGIISAVASSPHRHGFFAAGSYQNRIGIYDERHNSALSYSLDPPQGTGAGITQLAFSSDAWSLFSASRKSHCILWWDLRMPTYPQQQLPRSANTNQHIAFDLDPSSSVLASGTLEGDVLFYNLNNLSIDSSTQLPRPSNTLQAHKDCSNGCSFHPLLPLLATASGQRHLEIPNLEEPEDPSSSSSSSSSSPSSSLDVRLQVFGV